jgi:hypothetical protein
MDIWFAITALLDRPRRQPGPARIGLKPIRRRRRAGLELGFDVGVVAGFGVKVLDPTVT